MAKPADPIIDFPIERINKFLDSHTFEVPLHYDVFNGIRLPIKVKLTGMKNLISVGEWTPFIIYEFHIMPGNSSQNFITSIYFGDSDAKEIPSQVSSKSGDGDVVIHNLNVLLKNFLHYFSIDYGVTCDKGFNHVPYDIDIKNDKLR
jgi:hypothetical protein